MYNNSPRLIKVLTRTPSTLAPNTYTICDADQKVNCIPFLSSDKRLPKSPKCYNENYYNLKSFADENIKGGSTLRNKAPRSFSKTEECSSELSEEEDADPKKKIGRGKLYLCKVPHASTNTPSIPSKRCVGYNIRPNGRLEAKLTKTNDDLVGPGYYNIKQNLQCESYKGCRWSKRSAKRSTYDCHLKTPGPATYNLQENTAAKTCSKDEEYREMARLFTFLPRFSEAESLKTMRENLPGPGTYTPEKIRCCRSASIYPTPFISGAKRFKSGQCVGNPSPNLYEVAPGKIIHKDRYCAFSTRSRRFPEKALQEMPGPASYCIKSALTEKLQSKKNEFALIEPPFNTTTERETVQIDKCSAFTPSAADYNVDCIYACNHQNENSIFKSQVSRYCNTVANKSNYPIYNVSESFKKVRNPLSHNIAQTPFSGIEARKNVFDVTIMNPGPADYISQSHIECRSLTIPVSARFKDEEIGTPGPAYYMIHPAVNDSTYAAFHSYNKRLRASVLHKRHKHVVKEPWCDVVKQKKTLRWFANRRK